MTLRLAVGLTTAMAFSVCQAQTPTLDLFTFNSPPYQIAEAGQFEAAHPVSGETAETIRCAANRAGWATRIRITPQNRAMHSLKRNMIDGYFATDPSTELDAIARRSEPVALEKWYFFDKPGWDHQGTPRLGVVGGSNEEAWLESNGFPIFLTVGSPSQLLALLERGRIDSALMDERVMRDLRRESPQADFELESHFVRYAPLYLYLSETFVAGHPQFLPTFNRMLAKCMAGHLALTPDEQARIRNLAGRLVNELNVAFSMGQMIDAGPRQESFTDVMTLDSLWASQSPTTATPLAQTILELPGSRALFDWKVTTNGLVTEAMVMNDMGTLVAMSRLTSDYWQGDEPKFQQVLDNVRRGQSGEDAFYISPIRYDASTSRFQVTVSAPIGPVTEGVPMGVIALGLDTEDALRAPEPR